MATPSSWLKEPFPSNSQGIMSGGANSQNLFISLGRQRQVDLCEFKASLVYRVSSRTTAGATEKPCLKKTKTKTPVYFHTTA